MGPARRNPLPSSSPAKAFAGEPRQVNSTASVRASRSSAQTIGNPGAEWIPADEAGGDAAAVPAAEIPLRGWRQRALDRQTAA